MGLIKLAAQMITMPVGHLKNDKKELESIRQTAKKLKTKLMKWNQMIRKLKNNI